MRQRPRREESRSGPSRSSAPRRWLGQLAAALAIASLAGCNYSFRAGSFPPEHVQSVAVLPFENETARFELTQEVHQVMLRDLTRALGVQNAAEENADAVVRGTIRRYELTAPLYRPGADETRAEVLQREVALSVEVEIVDLVENVILWESRNLTARGQYLEDSESEEVGRVEAIDLLVQQIIDGAQSNW
jgi:hypothetical protein